ncbi:MAG TPA: dual specificity protein phosphatase [Anaerolineales bacterium]|nr:dual specificity protein phosphatase [Anaerolineales bacterium]
MNFSQITDDLFIGTTPRRRDYDVLRGLGVRLVINMRFTRGPKPHFRDLHIQYLWLRTFDNPLIPIPLRAFMRGVNAALETIHSGGKVYVHCAHGRHRSVAMGAAILIAQGMPAHQAMALIKARRASADPNIFYIRRRIMLFARRWYSKKQVS